MYSLRSVHQELSLRRHYGPLLHGQRYRLINRGLPVYAMVAPAGEGQFGNISMADLAEAIRQLGFADMYEVSLGGDMVADSEAREWLEAFNEGKKMTTSCCPAFVTMVKKHFPQLEANVSTTVSPMSAMARFIRAKHPGAITVFIGPCIAKKSEVIEIHYPGQCRLRPDL